MPKMREVEQDWTTEAGLRAVVLVVLREDPGGTERRSYRCGYVAVPKGHPLFGVAYNEQADCITREMVDSAPVGKKSSVLVFTCTCHSDGDDLIRRSPDLALDVHGGLTYSSATKGDYPAPAEDVWWFGFDCHHCDDAEIEPGPHSFSMEAQTVRSLEYVADECESLAAQLQAIPRD